MTLPRPTRDEIARMRAALAAPSMRAAQPFELPPLPPEWHRVKRWLQESAAVDRATDRAARFAAQTEPSA